MVVWDEEPWATGARTPTWWRTLVRSGFVAGSISAMTSNPEPTITKATFTTGTGSGGVLSGMIAPMASTSGKSDQPFVPALSNEHKEGSARRPHECRGPATISPQLIV